MMTRLDVLVFLILPVAAGFAALFSALGLAFPQLNPVDWVALVCVLLALFPSLWSLYQRVVGPSGGDQHDDEVRRFLSHGAAFPVVPSPVDLQDNQPIADGQRDQASNPQFHIRQQRGQVVVHGESPLVKPGILASLDLILRDRFMCFLLGLVAGASSMLSAVLDVAARFP